MEVERRGSKKPWSAFGCSLFARYLLPSDFLERQLHIYCRRFLERQLHLLPSVSLSTTLFIYCRRFFLSANCISIAVGFLERPKLKEQSELPFCTTEGRRDEIPARRDCRLKTGD
jgi:hypothetical protein